MCEIYLMISWEWNWSRVWVWSKLYISFRTCIPSSVFFLLLWLLLLLNSFRIKSNQIKKQDNFFSFSSQESKIAFCSSCFTWNLTIISCLTLFSVYIFLYFVCVHWATHGSSKSSADMSLDTKKSMQHQPKKTKRRREWAASSLADCREISFPGRIESKKKTRRERVRQERHRDRNFALKWHYNLQCFWCSPSQVVSKTLSFEKYRIHVND